MVEKENLPKFWDLKPLSEVCTLNPRKSEVKKLPDDERVTFLSMESVGEDGKIYSSEIKTLGEVFKGYTYFKKNDVLFAKITPCMENGKGAIADIDTKIGFGSTEFHVLRPKSEVLPEWIYLFLASKSIRKLAEMKMTGSAGQKRVPKSFFDKTKIPVPPLKTQQKIVEILEKAEKLKEWRAESDVLTDEYLKSVFLEMFGDPIQNSKSFQTSLLKDLCTFKSGGTPSRKHEEFFEGNIPWITTVALGPRYIDSRDAAEYITADAISKSATKLIPKDSVLIGTRVGVGKTSINRCEICTNQDIISLVDINKNLNKEFLLHLFSLYEGFFESQLRGATIKGITSSTLKNLNIILPLIDLQNQFAETVKKVEQLKAQQKQSKQEIDNLFNTLMQKAFKGELTC